MSASNTMHNSASEYDESLLRFLLRWAPFDGGEEEIYLTFGITPSTFYTRVGRLLETRAELTANHNVPALMAYCSRKARETMEY